MRFAVFSDASHHGRRIVEAVLGREDLYRGCIVKSVGNVRRRELAE